MIVSGFLPTVFVSNCLLHLYVRCRSLTAARQLFDHLPHRDIITWNILLAGYARSGTIDEARILFDAMPFRDVVSWNSLISGYSLAGDLLQSIAQYLEMRRSGVVFDRTTVAVTLKCCCSLQTWELGFQLHAVAVRAGIDCDTMAGTALSDFYAKCGLLGQSLSIFHGLPERNWVSWSTAIAGFVTNERFSDGLHMLKLMLREGSPASQSAYASAFKACAAIGELNLGKQLHVHAIKNVLSQDCIVGTAIVDVYAKSGALEESRKAFEMLPERTLQSWNAILVGHGQGNKCWQCMELFRAMMMEGIAADEITFSGVLRACAGSVGAVGGSQVHGLVIKSGLQSNICVTNSTIDMYGKCGMPEEARYLFSEMSKKDLISWNAIIAAFEQNGKYSEALTCCSRMLWDGFFPDEFTFGSIVKACSGLQSLDDGVKIHARLIKAGEGLNPFLGSILVDMYCKCGFLEKAQQLHDMLQEQTNVSWNAVISGFSLHRRTDEAQELFCRMVDQGFQPDCFTYATVLDICANLAISSLGKQIHAQIVKKQLDQDIFVSSTIVDMYSKCGLMQESLQMFQELKEKDVVSWNAMICGYSQHGLGEDALIIFAMMRAENVDPNHATFIAVLRACAHICSLEEGMSHFHSMSREFGLDPQLEHYSCMVDLLGRSGRTREAMELIRAMPIEADAVIWRTLLSACKARADVETAEKAAVEVLRLDPDDSAAYVLLSSSYAEAGKWEEVSKLRRKMREQKLKKEPGCSWIEVKGVVRMFLVGDEVCFACNAIRDALDALSEETKRSGYVPSLDPLLGEDEEEPAEIIHLMEAG